MTDWISSSVLLKVIPAIIAAIVFAYASQRAARWYLAAISASVSVDTTA